MIHGVEEADLEMGMSHGRLSDCDPRLVRYLRKNGYIAPRCIACRCSNLTFPCFVKSRRRHMRRIMTDGRRRALRVPSRALSRSLAVAIIRGGSLPLFSLAFFAARRSLSFSFPLLRSPRHGSAAALFPFFILCFTS